MERKITLYLTEKELTMLAHILRNFCDYVGGDDRPDHGWGNLMGYRDLPGERRQELYSFSAKINRKHYKSWKQK